MDIDAILKGIEQWSLSTAIREGLYSFPMLESIHVIGLAMVFGTIAIIDLRLMGLASTSRRFQVMAPQIVKWTWVGFVITLITGALMFITNASVYFHNTYFQIKMLLLVLAGVNMGIFESTLGRRAQQWDNGRPPAACRRVGAASMAIWIAVIVFGRLIGFTTSRVAQPVAPPPASVEDIF